jgi:hypothetical protein
MVTVNSPQAIHIEPAHRRGQNLARSFPPEMALRDFQFGGIPQAESVAENVRAGIVELFVFRLFACRPPEYVTRRRSGRRDGLQNMP